MRNINGAIVAPLHELGKQVRFAYRVGFRLFHRLREGWKALRPWKRRKDARYKDDVDGCLPNTSEPGLTDPTGHWRTTKALCYGKMNVRSISSKVDAINEDEEEMMYLTKEQEDLILVREIERLKAELAKKDRS